MKRLTLAYLNRVAEDHNKNNRGDSWTWEDVLYNECLCGNSVKNDIERMSKKETLIVMDWAAAYKDYTELSSFERNVYLKIYEAAKNSLMERL